MTACAPCTKGGWAACVCGGHFLDWQGLAPAGRPRAILEPFAQALEQTLRRNDHKPDWNTLHYGKLFQLARVELEETALAFEMNDAPNICPDLAAEALDVAACALFIWARANGIGKDRGRSL